MTGTLSPIPFRIPIGFWNDGVSDIPVTINPDWFNYLSSQIPERIGGPSGTSVTNLFNMFLTNSRGAAQDGEDGERGIGIQGPQGIQGVPGYSIRGDDGEPAGETRILITQNSKLREWASFTATRTGWTDVGAPTVTARYCTVENVCYFQVKVVPATTVATVAGTSYIALPVTALAAGLAGDGSMMNLTTFIGVGVCAFDVANSRVYVPAQAATANTLTIAGWYEI